MNEILFHSDKILSQLVVDYGGLTYLILCAIVLCETGFVIFPFLPGDGLLFAAGVLCVSGGLDPFVLTILLTIAAFAGNMMNLYIGRRSGKYILKSGFISTENLSRADQFYLEFGTKAIFIARFVPYIRTIIPFVAGISEMDVKLFTKYSFVGGIAWVSTFVGMGYFLGHIPFVNQYFPWIVFSMMALSWIPLIAGFLKLLKKKELLFIK
jgi:membrane-associated protein